MNLNKKIDRRHFAIGASTLPFMGCGSMAFGIEPNSKVEPHYFLAIILDGGADFSYMFDGRSIEMTKAGLIQNYFIGHKTLPSIRKPWDDMGGQYHLATSAVKPLEKFKNDLCIFNGVIMAADFDGHEQNMGYLFSGNPFGGPAFFPNLKSPDGNPSLDYVNLSSLGFEDANLSNLNNGLNADYYRASSIVKRYSKGGDTPFDEQSTILRHLRSRYLANSTGNGLFNLGSTALKNSIARAANVSSRLENVNSDLTISEKETHPQDRKHIQMICELFKSNLTNSGIIKVFPSEGNYDTHDVESARKQPNAFHEISEKIAAMIDQLKKTGAPTNDGRNMLDVTTVMISSEFGRTMRQTSKKIDESGTDHNPLSNTIMMLGKGVKGGNVVGASDFTTPNEVISGAHKEKERTNENFTKVMGRPFDFKAQATAAGSPEKYDQNNYLTSANIVNSIYRLFDVSESHHIEINRNGPKAKTLNKFIG